MTPELEILIFGGTLLAQGVVIGALVAWLLRSRDR